MKDTYPMSRREDIAAYVTKDGSQIRELLHPELHNNQHQSLAEATIPVGGKTKLHRHRRSEELYHVSAGRGRMTLGDEVFAIAVGDTVCIAPGTPHCVENRADTELVILCCCAPAYSHADTELLE
jgi:mannose-6-phosphate isomerase-like protein (cupin superfamily)